MELRHIHYFIAVAEELSFTRAAERLHIAQPPLSVQIRQLEDEIGVPLLRRTKRRVELTPAGDAFLEEARRILALVDRGVRAAREIGGGRRGVLRLGAVYSVIYAMIPSLLRAFGRCFPDVRVELTEMTVQQQIDALLRGEIDVGILRSPVSDERIATRLLFQEGIVGVVPRDHRLAARRSVSLAELTAEPFFLSGIGPHSSFRQHVLALLERLDRPVTITREVAEIHSIISLVGAGLGVSIAPASVRRIRVDDVAYLPISDPAPPIEVSLAWLAEVRPPMLARLLDTLAGPEMRPVIAALENREEGADR